MPSLCSCPSALVMKLLPLALLLCCWPSPISSQQQAEQQPPPSSNGNNPQQPLPNAGEQSVPIPSSGGNSAADGEQQPAKCGTKEHDFAPCMPKERADQLFKHCCEQYVPAGCQPLCQYEADELSARNLLLQAVKSKKCDLKHFGTILYCASQNQDNRKCCQHLNLADPKLGVGERCLRFCDPGGDGGISSIARSDVTCLFNWNVLMYCHHAGIKLS